MEPDIRLIAVSRATYTQFQAILDRTQYPNADALLDWMIGLYESWEGPEQAARVSAAKVEAPRPRNHEWDWLEG
jgi:hypothetical protein